MQVTFIITTHNQQEVVGRCLRSLPWDSKKDWEAVLVDDCSTDSTFRRAQEVLAELPTNRHQVEITTLKENSGGPSHPRNIGLTKAQGQYVFFIDGDDELDSSVFDRALESAIENDVDLLRLPMQIVMDGGKPRVVDRVSLSSTDTTVQVLEKCVTAQTMGVMAFTRRELIERNRIAFDENLKMGEDLIFMSEVCKFVKKAWFEDAPLYRYLKTSEAGSSATASYTSKMFMQAVASWNRVQENYLQSGVDFIRCHGAGSISYGLGQIQKYYVVPNVESFSHFAQFCKRWESSLPLELFGDPFRELVDAALKRDYERFKEGCKLRLLIAGHDLKFIKGAVPALEEFFQVRIDEWQSERQFDEKRTRENLAWAQVVWSEWMTYAAEWFSNNVRPSQKLILRCHFYELTRDSGFKMNRDRVSAIIAIAVHTYEDLVDKFDIPRNRVHLIPNFYDVDAYSVRNESWDPYALAFVGSVPRRKGFHRALQVLKQLRNEDPRYTLSVFGKAPEDFGWVNGVEPERQYYDACNRYIKENGLEEAIRFPGWSDMRSELRNYGCVLSTSDFEGSHVAPGEAFCAEIPMAVLNWRGARYVYPNEFIYSSVDEIIEAVRTSSNDGPDSEGLENGRSFFRRHQDIPVFVQDVKELILRSKTIYEL